MTETREEDVVSMLYLKAVFAKILEKKIYLEIIINCRIFSFNKSKFEVGSKQYF